MIRNLITIIRGWLTNYWLKIGLSLFLSFFISSLLINYFEFSNNGLVINTVKASDGINLVKEQMIKALRGLTAKINIGMSTSTKEEFSRGGNNSIAPNENEKEDQSKIDQPTEPESGVITNNNVFNNGIPTPTRINFNPSPTKKPTLKPTKKPTNQNNTSYPPAPKEDQRQGKGLEDIYNIASKATCVPVAMLKAIVHQEAGGGVSYGDKQAVFYNAYNWWKRATEAKQVCGGYGFIKNNSQKIISNDSNFSGESCGETWVKTYDSGLGVGQIIDSTWRGYEDRVKSALKVRTVDRRVFVDSLVAIGLIVRGRSGYSNSCSSWALKYVARGACRYAGSCGTYCNTICTNYNTYSREKYDCSKAASSVTMVNGSCTVK